MKKFHIASVNFNKEKGTIMANVAEGFDVNAYDCGHFIKENQFHIKDEFHITVVGFQEGKNIVENQQTIEKIESLIQKYSADNLGNSGNSNNSANSSGNVLFIEKEYAPDDYRFSLVAECSSVGLSNLRKEVDTVLQTKTKPYWHITLATRTAEGEAHAGIGIRSSNDLLTLKPKVIHDNEIVTTISSFVVPTRMQPDTVASIFLLQEFGSQAGYTILPDYAVEINPKPQNSFWDAMKEGAMQLDCIGGLLDHHTQETQTTLTELVKVFVQQKNNPSLDKLSAYVERDDFHGKGTISTDMLDKAFGLSGLLTAFNKVHADTPAYIAKSITPLYKAHYEEERKRNEYLPQLVDQLKSENKISEAKAKQRKKKVDIVFVESDEASLPGYLRSSIGGRYDIVVQRRASGHTNIITRPLKNIDIRSLVALVRKSELMMNKKDTHHPERYLSGEGVLPEVEQWYYDRATNTLQNGGLNEGGVLATSIPFEAFKKIAEAGISETYWNPLQR